MRLIINSILHIVVGKATGRFLIVINKKYEICIFDLFY